MFKKGDKVKIKKDAYVEEHLKGKIGKVIAVSGDELSVKMNTGTIIYVSEDEVQPK